MVTTFDQKIAEYLNNWNINGWPVGNLVLCAIALFLTVVLCGAIGIERERKGRSAGLRTHLLVGVGSCIIMIISIYGFPSATEGKRDVARLVAQVVTGIGFLGAGVIMHRNGGGVRGLTTAASIWVVMTIGIACGSFNFILALAGTILILVVLTVFKKVEEYVAKNSAYISITAPADTPLLDTVLTVSMEFNCTIHNVSTELITSSSSKVVLLTFQVVFDSSKDKINEYIAKIEKEANIISIQIL